MPGAADCACMRTALHLLPDGIGHPHVCVQAHSMSLCMCVQTLTLVVSSAPGCHRSCHTFTRTAFAFLPEFEEPRVIDLWDLAKSSNFTEKELESFRVRTVPVTPPCVLWQHLLSHFVLMWKRF